MVGCHKRNILHFLMSHHPCSREGFWRKAKRRVLKEGQNKNNLCKYVSKFDKKEEGNQYAIKIHCYYYHNFFFLLMTYHRFPWKSNVTRTSKLQSITLSSLIFCGQIRLKMLFSKVQSIQPYSACDFQIGNEVKWKEVLYTICKCQVWNSKHLNNLKLKFGKLLMYLVELNPNFFFNMSQKTLQISIFLCK